MARRRSAECDDDRTRKSSEERDKTGGRKEVPEGGKTSENGDWGYAYYETCVWRIRFWKEVEHDASYVFRNRRLIKRLTSNVTVNREYKTHTNCQILYLPCSFRAKRFNASCLAHKLTISVLRHIWWNFKNYLKSYYLKKKVHKMNS